MDIADFDLSDPDAAAFCPACGAGYTAGRARCRDCDRELLPRSEIEAMLAAPDEPTASPPPREPSLEAPPGPAPEFDLSDPDAIAFCPSCGSGYRAGVLVCVDCGSELRPRSWVESRPSGGEPAEDLVALADIESSFKAQVLGAALEDQGILFFTQASGSGAIRFLVQPVDLDLAREVLSDVDEIQPIELPEDE